ncbi:MAG TPA: hypothetical protein VFS43_12595 [Polyangiaceae bacterium]|nr:hypothetical protein [Polyangiaceae bacterium]
MRVFSLSLVAALSLAPLTFVACGSELEDDPLPTAGRGGAGGRAGSGGSGGSGTMGTGGSGTMGTGGSGTGGSGTMGTGGSGTMGAGGGTSGTGGGAGAGGAGQGGGGAGGSAGGGGTGGVAGQGGGGAGGGGKVINFCNVQFPATLCSTPGNAPAKIVYGQVFVDGLTNTNTGPAPGIKSEIGFGKAGTDPRTDASWVFAAAVINSGFNFTQNNDEYQATLPAQAEVGSFSYVYRVSVNGGDPLYCDTNGTTADPNDLPFAVADLGAWTVAATCP